MNRKKSLPVMIYAALMASASPVYAGTGVLSYEMGYESQFGSGGTGDGEFYMPEQVLIDSNNNIIVADANNYRIQIFDIHGNYISQFGGNGSAAGEFNRPYTLTFGPDNTLIVGEFAGGRLQIFDSNYQSIGFVTSPNGFNGANGVAFSPTGELYVSDFYGNKIQVFTSDGSGGYVYDREVSTAAAGGLNGGGYMVFAPDGIGQDGRYYVADFWNGRIQVYNADDSFAGFIGEGMLSGPEGISVDKYGNFYIGEYFANKVSVYSKDGVFLASFGTTGTADGEFRDIESVYIGPDGKIYVSDSTNNRVQLVDFISHETFTAAPASGNETATTPVSVVHLDGTAATSFANNFIGYTAMDVTGDWTLGGNSSFASAASVSTGGALYVNGTLSAPVINVASGALIGGTGTLAGDLVNNGMISPGNNSIGSLAITGNYTGSASSAYNLDVNALGQSDKITVSGDADLDGGTLNINAANGNYAASTNYTILTATGDLTNTFGTINNNLAFLTPTLSYDSHNAFLNLVNPNAQPTQVDFIPFATTGSQLAVANSINAYSAGGFNGDTALATTVVGLNNQEAAAFLKQTTPDDIATLAVTQMQSLTQLQAPLWQRMDALQTPMPDSPSSMGNYAMMTPAAGGVTARNVWLEAIGGVMNQDSYDGATGYRSTVAGARAGIDHLFDDSLVFGVSGAYIKTHTGFDLSANKAESTYGHLDIYGQKNFNGLVLEGFLGAGAGRIETTRYISAGGLDRVARGDADAYDANAAVKLSQAIPVATNLDLIPSIAATASWQRQASFTEEGAGALNMDVDAVTVTPVTVKPMLTVQKLYSAPEQGMNMVASFGAGAIWQVNERESSVTAGFSGSNVPQFSVLGAKQKPVSASLAAAFTMQPTEKESYIPSATFSATSQFNSVSTNHTGTLHLTWNW